MLPRSCRGPKRNLPAWDVHRASGTAPRYNETGTTQVMDASHY